MTGYQVAEFPGCRRVTWQLGNPATKQKPHAAIDVGPSEKQILEHRRFSFF
jgi:hypothetical protein